jgi:hypothetical protein
LSIWYFRYPLVRIEVDVIANRWKGSEVVCIASGPSLSAEDCCAVSRWRSASSNRRIIVVNTSYLLVPRADVLYGCDRNWWAHQTREVDSGRWPGFSGERWSISKEAAEEFGVRLVPHQLGEGLSTECIHAGGNGGYQAVQLAALFGASKIILLGYDLKRTMGRSHWHGDHPAPLKDPQSLEDWARRLDRLVPRLVGWGIDLLNASRETALKRFPRISLEEALT